MALIKSEISKYKEMVLALDREMQNRGKAEIVWDHFISQDRKYRPHSVVVCKVSDELKAIGFMPTFIYDKEHFQNSMYPEDSRAPHSHGLTADELLRLPKMLNNPVAILTERNGKMRDLGDGEYRCLHFILASNEDGEQKYYRAVVHPQTFHNGILGSGFASKVVTYHKMDELRFNAMLNGAIDGERQLLYFNSEKYLRIQSDTKPLELYAQQSVSLPIGGHFTADLRLRKISQDHKASIQRAVTAEMNKLILGRSTRGEEFPLLKSSLNALAHGNDIHKIQSAYNTVQKITELTPDRILKMRVQEYTDKSFAQSYIRLLSTELQQKYIDMAVRKVQAVNARTQSDLNGVCDEIDRVVSAMPTLKNLNVHFSDSVAHVSAIMEARAISGKLQEALETRLADVLRDKTRKIENVHYEHEDAAIEINTRFNC